MDKNNTVRKPPVKKGLHPRNANRFNYDYKALVESCPGLAPFMQKNRYGNESVNYSDPVAVRMLNRALLMHFYGIEYWDIPENYLCPPIPGRADYIHYVADLLASCNGGTIPEGKAVSVLDIGVGANCIYPIIGTHEYGWRFTGADIDRPALDSAEKIVKSNSALSGLVALRFQKKPSDIFRGVIRPDELFDISICNPPFHSSPENAQAAASRKRNNLRSDDGSGLVLNFGGQSNELVDPWRRGAFCPKNDRREFTYSGKMFMVYHADIKKNNHG
jgi:23S rRNA (adenine1618-N6)-methyltransferase